MDEKQQRLAMVLIAALGLASEVHARRRIVASITGGQTTRAAQYHGAMLMYRRAAEWFGRQALRAEASYWEEVRGSEQSAGKDS